MFSFFVECRHFNKSIKPNKVNNGDHNFNNNDKRLNVDEETELGPLFAGADITYIKQKLHR